MRVLFLGFSLATWAAGCAQQPTLGSSSSAVTGNCPDWGCLSNAASMGERLVFHELDACGRDKNDAGIRMVGFQLSGVDLKLQVQGDEMVAFDPKTANRFTGNQLVGGVLKLESTATREFFDVAITQWGQTDFWVDPAKQVSTYTFRYRIGQAPPHYPEAGDREGFDPLCAGKHLDTESHALDEQLAIVFGTDRYNARAKTVTIAPGECWFNVACAGSAVAKMHLLRHTDAGSDGKHTTVVTQRQAMLKTITDDICGTGRSFTQDGEDVYYQDVRAWHPLPRTLGTMEAVWDENGAVCLDEPRRLQEEPGIRAAIVAECAARWPGTGCTPAQGPPRCSAIGIDLSTWTSNPAHYAISVNPP